MQIDLLIRANVCIFDGVLKKLFAILVLLVYVPAIAGVSFSTHYCWGEIKETKVFSYSKQSCCCEEAEEETHGCCSDNIRIIKLDNDQEAGSRLSIKPTDLVLPYAFEIPSFKISTYPVQPVFANDALPPLIKPVKRSVFHCCFLI